jgi:hypothetical protein
MNLVRKAAQQRGEMPLGTRAAPIQSVDADKRTVSLVWTTGARVLRYDWWNDRQYWEELSLEADAVDLSRLQAGAPLLNTHDQWRLSSVIGVVESASIDSRAEQGLAEVRFSQRDDVEPLFRDVRDGIIRNVSVGYQVLEWDRIPPSDTEPRWIYRAVRWQPTEISLVPVGADAGAGVRSAEQARAQGVRLVPCVFNDFELGAADLTQPAGTAADNNSRKEPEMAGQTGTTAVASSTATQQQTAVQAPALDEAARQAAVAEGQRLEAERRSGILALDVGSVRGLVGEEFVRKLADDVTVSVDEARKRILGEMAKKSEATSTRGVALIETVSDERDNFARFAEEAMLHRLGRVKDLSEGARQYRYLSTRGLAEQCLRIANISTRGMAPMQIIEAALSASRGFHVAGDFASILANVANKGLRAQYMENEPSYTRWARRGAPLADFKPITVGQLSNAPDLQVINETGEIKFGSMSDQGVTYQALSYARGVRISRQALLNDDLSAFDRIIPAMGMAVRRLENRLVYANLTSNPTVLGSALFAAGRSNNLTGATSALDAANGFNALRTGRANMRLQKGLQGEELNLAPHFLIVPATLEQNAYQFTSSQYVPAQQSNVSEFRQGGRTALEPIVEAVLDAASTTAWYLAADNSAIDTVEYRYLEGFEGPRITTNVPFDNQGLEIKVEHDFASQVIDFRGLLRSVGA